MKTLTEAIYAIALTLWIGGLWAVGYLVAPTLFYTLADRALGHPDPGAEAVAVWLGAILA